MTEIVVVGDIVFVISIVFVSEDMDVTVVGADEVILVAAAPPSTGTTE